jgi:hypothetical protein
MCAGGWVRRVAGWGQRARVVRAWFVAGADAQDTVTWVAPVMSQGAGWRGGREVWSLPGLVGACGRQGGSGCAACQELWAGLVRVSGGAVRVVPLARTRGLVGRGALGAGAWSPPEFVGWLARMSGRRSGRAVLPLPGLVGWLGAPVAGRTPPVARCASVAACGLGGRGLLDRASGTAVRDRWVAALRARSGSCPDRLTAKPWSGPAG